MESVAAAPCRRPHRWLLVALATCAVVRLYLLWQYYCISSDGVVYIDAAQEFFAGDVAGGLASVYPPGYPVLMALAYGAIGNWELAGQLLSLAFGIVLLFPLYFLMRDVFSERVALIACFLAAVSPYLARYSVHVRTESIFICFLLFALLLFYRGLMQQSPVRFFWGGLVAGYAYLIRPEAIGFLVVVPAFLMLRILLRQETLIGAARQTGGLAAGFFLMSLPFIVYLSVDTGQWGAITRKAGITLAIALNESGVLEGTDVSADVNSLGFVDFIRRHPLLYMEKLVRDIPGAIDAYFEALHYSFVPFLLVGFFLMFGEKLRRRKDLMLLTFVFFCLASFMLVYVKRRYSLQAVPVSLGWVALGWLTSIEFIRCRIGYSARAVGVSLALLLMATTLPKTLKPISRDKAHVRSAGWFLKERDGAGAKTIAVFDGRIAFYAEAMPVFLHDVDQAELIERLRQNRVNFVASDAGLWQESFPEIAASPERYGLILEREFIGERRDRLVIFRVS